MILMTLSIVTRERISNQFTGSPIKIPAAFSIRSLFNISHTKVHRLLMLDVHLLLSINWHIRVLINLYRSITARTNVVVQQLFQIWCWLHMWIWLLQRELDELWLTLTVFLTLNLHGWGRINTLIVDGPQLLIRSLVIDFV